MESSIATLFAQIIEALGLDLNDENLKDTPKRVAKMYCREFFSGVGTEFDNYKAFPNKHKYNQIILSDLISFTSVCSHHFLPFTGHAWLLYIPDKLLVGYSKMARAVNHYACRPQLQENLCHEVLNSFCSGVKPQGAMVVMRAVHSCSACRGVKQNNGSGMMTSAVRGVFLKDPYLEQKGYDLIKISVAYK